MLCLSSYGYSPGLKHDQIRLQNAGKERQKEIAVKSDTHASKEMLPDKNIFPRRAESS